MIFASAESGGAIALTCPPWIWTSIGSSAVLLWKWSPSDANLIGP